MPVDVDDLHLRSALIKEARAGITTALYDGPYPITGKDKVVEYSFGYWYNYFFREVPRAQKPKFILAVVDDDGSFRTEGNVANKKALFTEMLQLGFQSFALRDSLTRDELFDHMLKNLENTTQRDFNVNVLFRGDSRGPERIKQDNGTVPQTRLQGLREQRNMSKEWHPFSDSANRSKVWFRKGTNADNCLFSAVSVTPQFLVATKFPLLDDLLASNPGAVGSSIVICKKVVQAPQVVAASNVLARAKAFDQQVQTHQNSQQSGKYSVDRPERSLLASRTQIYVIKGQGVYNTQALQVGSEFPEYALKAPLGWADHLACFDVVRVHYSTNSGNVGHLIVITKFRWLHEPQALTLMLGVMAYGSLKSHLEEIAQSGALTSAGTGGIPYQAGIPVKDISKSPQFMLEDGGIYEIESIKQLFMSTRGAKTAFTNVPAPVVVKAGAQPGKVNIPQAFKK
ncbi:MAG: hypothetical protein MUF01_07445 [Bryobacterales bacterium]|nr:hypothetical protein [Bryobacterales bacterium]